MRQDAEGTSETEIQIYKRMLKMPYIKKEDREKFNQDFEGMSLDGVAEMIGTEGELNYVITVICHGYIKKHGKSYGTLNAVHGVLSCCDSELYRRVTAPYEDEKIKENGDVE